MSAYSNGRSSQVLSFSTPSNSASEPLDHHLPSLPQIASELEAFFSAARQIEAGLAQERAQARKYREELREIQMRYSHFSSEVETRLKESALREEKFKAQLTTQASAQQQNEKNYHDQLNDLCQQIESLRDDKKKVEVEVEILKSHLEHLKRNEGSLKTTLRSFQSGEKTRIEHSEHLTRELNKELNSARAELQRYKAAWGQISAIDRKAKNTLQQSAELGRRLEEQLEVSSREKKYREGLEDLLQREKREKHAALTCLHSAESKLAVASRELEELRSRKAQSFDDRSIELKF